jgi:hypothetical protein
MSHPLNPEDLTVESLVTGSGPDGLTPGPGEMYVDSVIWYTNTRPVPVSNTACSACIA